MRRRFIRAWGKRRRGRCCGRSSGSGGAKILPAISRGGGPGEAWWRGSFRVRGTPPPRFARSPSPANAGEDLVRRPVQPGRALGEDLAAVLGDADAVLELRREGAVAGHGGPAVLE